MELPNKQQIIKKLKEKNNIIILPMRLSGTSKCQCCKLNDDKYAVFIGGTKLSDLLNTCCGQCLYKIVDEAAELRVKYIKSGIESIESHFNRQSS